MFLRQREEKCSQPLTHLQWYLVTELSFITEKGCQNVYNQKENSAPKQKVCCYLANFQPVWGRKEGCSSWVVRDPQIFCWWKRFQPLQEQTKFSAASPVLMSGSVSNKFLPTWMTKRRARQREGLHVWGRLSIIMKWTLKSLSKSGKSGSNPLYNIYSGR